MTAIRLSQAARAQVPQGRAKVEDESLMEQERESFDNFLEWAAKLGISDSTIGTSRSRTCLGHSLSVSYFTNAGGRGLGAVRNLRKGELILKVPKSALITTDCLLRDNQLFVVVKRHPSLSSTQILTVCLLYEMGRGKRSPWHPYLMHLPRYYDILASFDVFEKQALQVDYAIWATEKAVLKAESDWKDATKLMEELKLKRQLQIFRAWLWASATISSRTLHIPWDGAGCLCPVGDLFNYAAPGELPLGLANLEISTYFSSAQVNALPIQNTEDNLDTEQLDGHFHRLTDGGFEEDVAAYCFYARKYYEKGEQVLLSYGTYTNLELLEHYGFLLNENPNEKVFIPLESDIYSLSSWSQESLYINQFGEPSYALLSALRLWATPPAQRRSLGHIAYSGSPLSLENELSVMKWISDKCHLVLKNLPTSLEEDSLLLAVIDKIQDSCILLQLEKVFSNLRDEVCAFLESNGLVEQSAGNLILSENSKRSLEKWKLAVQWRHRYKKSVVDCISFCTEVIDLLSSQRKEYFNNHKSTRKP